MRICGLLGKDIQYSKSPTIHNEYYKQNNIELKYELFDLEKDQISDFIDNLRSNNIVGFNVTIPYKEYIIDFLNDFKYPAKEIGAINTVVITNNKLIGYNTDYNGFIKSLEVNNIDIRGLNALIIGTGGSAKCVYHALLQSNIGDVHIATRNISKNKKYFTKASKIINNDSLNNYEYYDILINCTPVGGANKIGMSPIQMKNLKSGALIYDLNYEPNETEFMKQGKKLGARILNGKSMLKYQAYYAIDIWKKHMEK